MAGDEYSIYLCDHMKKILEERYLGKLRYYKNKFSLKNYQYTGNNTIYEIEERMSDGKNTYCVLTQDTISEIRNSLLEEPLSEGEKMAYEDTKEAIEWIDDVLCKYSETYVLSSILDSGSMHFVFYTNRDL
jgi:hypothetical protein